MTRNKIHNFDKLVFFNHCKSLFLMNNINCMDHTVWLDRTVWSSELNQTFLKPWPFLKLKLCLPSGQFSGHDPNVDRLCFIKTWVDGVSSSKLKLLDRFSFSRISVFGFMFFQTSFHVAFRQRHRLFSGFSGRKDFRAYAVKLYIKVEIIKKVRQALTGVRFGQNESIFHTLPIWKCNDFYSWNIALFPENS